MKMSQKLLDEIDKALAEVDNRKKSPELEELEHFALSLEDRLQRALAQIQHTSLKVTFLTFPIDIKLFSFGYPFLKIPYP